MKKWAYYNENDPYAAQWIRNLIAAGHVAPGEVDERSICDVQPEDVAEFVQAHWFAGIAGWSYAARLAGWPDDRLLWTGSCPCQPFSVAGKGAGQADQRHLWPEFFRLIRACRPAVVMGEQVAAAVGKDWLDGVSADLEGIGYTCGATVVPACSVDAPHRRDRLWFVADAAGQRRERREIAEAGSFDHGASAGRLEEVGGPIGGCETRHDVDDALGARLEGHARHGDGCGRRAEAARPVASTGGVVSDAHGIAGGQGCPLDGRRDHGSGAKPWAGLGRNSRHWDGAEWAVGADGKARRVGSDLRGVVDGLSESLDGLCADFYAEAAEEVARHATAEKCGPREILRAVRDQVATQAVWQDPRGFHGIREAEVLLPFLRELEDRFDTGRVPGAVTEVTRGCVRSSRIYDGIARAPQGRRSVEQRAGQHPDALHVLPQLLARAARQAFEAIVRDAPPLRLLAHGIEARVGKLRAMGNAIVPQVAAEVIGAYLEARAGA